MPEKEALGERLEDRKKLSYYLGAIATGLRAALAAGEFLCDDGREARSNREQELQHFFILLWSWHQLVATSDAPLIALVPPLHFARRYETGVWDRGWSRRGGGAPWKRTRPGRGQCCQTGPLRRTARFSTDKLARRLWRKHARSAAREAQHLGRCSASAGAQQCCPSSQHAAAAHLPSDVSANAKLGASNFIVVPWLSRGLCHHALSYHNAH